MTMARKGCLFVSALLLVLVLGAVLLAWIEGRSTPGGRSEYVALGSSFAAGAGLGPLQRGSPHLCARSVNGYPQQLARMLKLEIVDMSCGGATTTNLLRGGQFFQGPQARTISGATRLVTITVGGNDIGYISDLSLLAARRGHTLFDWLTRQFWKGPKEERDYRALNDELDALLVLIHHKAPSARIVIATYPAILPATGSCAKLQLSAQEVRDMREVADKLARTSRAAALKGGALLVDMNALGSLHNACSPDPWTRGWTNGGIAPFHPTLSGARATASAIAEALRRHQQL